MDDRMDRKVSQHPAVILERGDTKIPTVILDAGGAARFAFEEFFQGQIRNPYTRKAYLHTIRLFSDWCQQRGLELIRVTPADVARFLDGLSVASPTRMLHLASLRRFLSPFASSHDDHRFTGAGSSAGGCSILGRSRRSSNNKTQRSSAAASNSKHCRENFHLVDSLRFNTVTMSRKFAIPLLTLDFERHGSNQSD